MDEQIKLTGTLAIKVNDVLVQEVKNLVVTAGKTWIATTIQAGTGTPMSYMAVGTNNTAAAAGDTALLSEVGRVAVTVAGGQRTNNVLVFEGVFPAGTGTGSLTEAGIFNATPAGTMLSRSVFSTVTKGASDQLTITWTITIS